MAPWESQSPYVDVDTLDVVADGVREEVVFVPPPLVWALPSEYLKQGEAENIVREWSEALGGAGIDYFENKAATLEVKTV
ncbi:hypothetical protein Bca52824_062572 [Brassica carinata]|uniref:Uncharacterized protein n=1 Tax=Brassica carinata TaxID=52824 RepID=A0A8X7QEX8_BRACI|nr:hypothetical protein Bca52824_062572 [Brassica carinata]